MSVKKCDNLSISPWIRRFSNLVPEEGCVLDLAAGCGRHSAWFLDRGHTVTAVDRQVDRFEISCSAAARSRLEIVEADLEDGSPWPLGDRQFDAVIVANYLHRPLFPQLMAMLARDGVLLYDTFAMGQEMYGKPGNPDFLLKPGELLTAVRGRLQVVAYEHGLIDDGRGGPAVKQRIAAIDRHGPAVLTVTG